jgi:hypothetical protein
MKKFRMGSLAIRSISAISLNLGNNNFPIKLYGCGDLQPIIQSVCRRNEAAEEVNCEMAMIVTLKAVKFVVEPVSVLCNDS